MAERRGSEGYDGKPEVGEDKVKKQVVADIGLEEEGNEEESDRQDGL